MHTHCTQYFNAYTLAPSICLNLSNLHICHIYSETPKHADTAHVFHCKHTGTRYLPESDKLAYMPYLSFQNCILNVVLQLLFSVCRRVPIPFAGMGILVLGSGMTSSLMRSSASWTERASAPSAEGSLGSPHADLSLLLWRRGGGTPPILSTFLLRGICR